MRDAEGDEDNEDTEDEDAEAEEDIEEDHDDAMEVDEGRSRHKQKGRGKKNAAKNTQVCSYHTMPSCHANIWRLDIDTERYGQEERSEEYSAAGSFISYY